MRGRSGFSMIELMVGISLLGVISWGVFNGVEMWNGQFDDMQEISTGHNIVSEILNSLVVRGPFLQVDQTDDAGITILTDWKNSNKLPMAWSKGGAVYPVVECSASNFDGSCPRGRYGFIVKPVTGFRGLYKVTILITHPEWTRARILNAITGE
ncbi:MAG: prepilin-type N-terminal cleavage/methylation domain-containing protein [Bdellovibrionales bacterium]|jgi:prepilin-type N-terminal cleavage/methylation domain-containing protein|nr:prepilin-type N-terminal cleavage/methylation domain-containing protein [Bdellovibrionales bacterium]MBT3525977.1 prepilin-type N-terminal cleavage/methylation domain-containing protein [Bdellovibrionales bacterium]MBT7670580.1 prepilin-type N-terminal cleavage/methylation domain-containing protein [Bdellovibrionales bacterium]MBT7766898.1 prepilin-type N-terminal cleavage/methylation domain-containing protein [Bdellovibrionales bacterium]